MIHNNFGVVLCRSDYKDKQFLNTMSALQRHALPAIWMKHMTMELTMVLIQLVASYDYGINNGIDTSCWIVWLWNQQWYWYILLHRMTTESTMVLIHLVSSYDYGINNGIDTSCCIVWLWNQQWYWYILYRMTMESTMVLIHLVA